MYQINFYVPEDHVQSVKLAMFKAGAGKIGNYEYCSFEIAGVGQFRPVASAKPFLGEIGSLEVVKEVKVEMVCEKALIKGVIAALKATHPYETPAYHVLELLNF